MRPDASHPISPKKEEANDPSNGTNTVPVYNLPRRPRMARHSKNDDAELFPTPLPPAPAVAGTGKPGRILPAPTPDYPLEARVKKQEGVVKVRVRVDETGKIIDVEIVSSSGSPSLDKRAVRAARQRKYEPRKQGDIAVATSFPLTFRFSLTD